MKAVNLPYKPFGYYFKSSFFVHGLLFIIFIVAGIFFKSEVDKIKKHNLKLVQSSVKVDVVAMPKFSVQELKSLQQQVDDSSSKSKVDTRIEKEPTEVIQKDSYKVEKKKTSFQDMLKKYSKKVDKKVAKAKKLNNKKYQNKANLHNNKELKNLVMAGNKLSKGESLVDGKAVTSSSEFEQYAGVLPNLVRTNWSIPSYLAEQELKCRIRIFVNHSGRLIKAQIYESSGNDEYDLRALNAVKKTNYPIPSQKIKKSVRDGVILLGFPL